MEYVNILVIGLFAGESKLLQRNLFLHRIKRHSFFVSQHNSVWLTVVLIGSGVCNFSKN
jgi:hypothetical protein